MGAGFVIFFACKIDIFNVIGIDCPGQKLGYSFYMLVGSVVSFLVSAITSCCANGRTTVSTINYVI